MSDSSSNQEMELRVQLSEWKDIAERRRLEIERLRAEIERTSDRDELYAERQQLLSRLQAAAGGYQEMGDILLKRTAVETEIERLRSVAVAAKALADIAAPWSIDYELVSERKLTALESALEAAGYGMSDEEMRETTVPPATSEDYMRGFLAAVDLWEHSNVHMLRTIADGFRRNADTST